MPFFFLNGRPECKFPFAVAVSTMLSEQLLCLASLLVVLLAVSWLLLTELLRRLSWCGILCMSKREKKKAKVSGDKHSLLKRMDYVTINVDLFSALSLGLWTLELNGLLKVGIFFVLPPSCHIVVGQGFILLCGICVTNENEASGMRNKMSLCRCRCVDPAMRSGFSLA